MENIKSQHLGYFKVENFKCLSALELKNIGKFNLILGDNNVGKSTVLEALLFEHLPYKLQYNLFQIFSYRSFILNVPINKVDYIDFFINSRNSEKSFKYEFQYKGNSKIEYIKLSVINSNGISQRQVDSLIKNTLVNISQLPENIISLNSDGNEELFTIDFNFHRIKDGSPYFPYIKSGLIYQNDLVDFYSRNIANNILLKKEFLNSLLILSEDIYDITIDTTTVSNNPILLVLFKNGQKPIPLFMMGDGTIRLVRLILEIIMSKNSRLMIDEIDNGIHFSRMKEVWLVLLKVADKNNTQLFITTHDSECLRAYKEALEDKDLSHLQNEVGSYTLIKNKSNQIEAVKYNFQEFEHAINYSLNVRGGSL